METGKFTLYRDTHGKAIMWFVGMLVVIVLMASSWPRHAHAEACVVEPWMLGRFIVTPHDARFVRPTVGRMTQAWHPVAKCG